jgi:hypothetical protein
VLLNQTWLHQVQRTVSEPSDDDQETSAKQAADLGCESISVDSQSGDSVSDSEVVPTRKKKKLYFQEMENEVFDVSRCRRNDTHGVRGKNDVPERQYS